MASEKGVLHQGWSLTAYPRVFPRLHDSLQAGFLFLSDFPRLSVESWPARQVRRPEGRYPVLAPARSIDEKTAPVTSMKLPLR